MYSIYIEFLNIDNSNTKGCNFDISIGNTTDILEYKGTIYQKVRYELCIFMVSEYNCNLLKMKVYDDCLSADTFYDRLFGNIMQRGGLTNGESDIYTGILAVAGAIQNAYNKGKQKEIEAASKEECKPIKFDARLLYGYALLLSSSILIPETILLSESQF